MSRLQQIEGQSLLSSAKVVSDLTRLVIVSVLLLAVNFSAFYLMDRFFSEHEGPP